MEVFRFIFKERTVPDNEKGFIEGMSSVMPYVAVQEARVNYEVHGDGPPLVMIPGLATGLLIWRLQVASLKHHFQCVLIDNRGSGDSDVPDSIYTTALMAEDVVAVLDALEISVAHMLGFSFGGAIAQELALAHPSRIDRMILSNSFARVTASMSEELHLWKNMAQDDRMDQFCSDLVAQVFSPEHLKKHSREVMAFRLAMMASPPSALGLLRQIEAVEAHDTRDRLASLHCATLVVGASNDRVVPVALSEELCSEIPHATLRIFSRGGHAVFVEEASLYNDAVMGFLRDGG
jgi:aminoacrylate hydrolase